LKTLVVEVEVQELILVIFQLDMQVKLVVKEELLLKN